MMSDKGKGKKTPSKKAASTSTASKKTASGSKRKTDTDTPSVSSYFDKSVPIPGMHTFGDDDSEIEDNPDDGVLSDRDSQDLKEVKDVTPKAKRLSDVLKRKRPEHEAEHEKVLGSPGHILRLRKNIQHKWESSNNKENSSSH